MKEQSMRRRAEKKVIARRTRIYREAIGHWPPIGSNFIPGKFRKRHMGCGCSCCKPWKWVSTAAVQTIRQRRADLRFKQQLEEMRYE